MNNIILECSTITYGKLCNGINDAYNDTLPSYFIATKHRLKLISGEIEYVKDLMFLMPKSSPQLLERSDDPDDYEGKKLK